MYGVPQGSILKSLVFIIFVNDLKGVLKRLVSIIFAGETNLHFFRKNIKKLFTNVNLEFQKLNQ